MFWCVCVVDWVLNNEIFCLVVLVLQAQKEYGLKTALAMMKKEPKPRNQEQFVKHFEMVLEVEMSTLVVMQLQKESCHHCHNASGGGRLSLDWCHIDPVPTWSRALTRFRPNGDP